MYCALDGALLPAQRKSKYGEEHGDDGENFCKTMRIFKVHVNFVRLVFASFDAKDVLFFPKLTHSYRAAHTHTQHNTHTHQEKEGKGNAQEHNVGFEENRMGRRAKTLDTRVLVTARRHDVARCRGQARARETHGEQAGARGWRRR